MCPRRRGVRPPVSGTRAFARRSPQKCLATGDRLHRCCAVRIDRSRVVKKSSGKTRGAAPRPWHVACSGVPTVTSKPRPVAWLIIVLIVLPFTAPFSTCDLSALIASREGRAPTWTSPDVSMASMDAVSALAASASFLEEKQVKDGALTLESVIVLVSTRSETAAPLVIRGTVARATLTLRL